jgi:hypothetical protein
LSTTLGPAAIDRQADRLVDARSGVDAIVASPTDTITAHDYRNGCRRVKPSGHSGLALRESWSDGDAMLALASAKAWKISMTSASE